MGGDPAPLTGPDFSKGVELSEVPDNGMLLGNTAGEAVLLVRQGDQAFAIGATCTHYGGPLVDGVVVDGGVRCPWHHACFSVRTGQPLRPPALNPVTCWKVEKNGSRVVVREKAVPLPGSPRLSPPESVVIVGAGAAGNVAAETLRREGYAGPITLIGAEPTGPVDRPNLSKDYLAGNAPEEWIPLRGDDYYASQRIELLLGSRVVSIDAKNRDIQLADGTRRSYGALLLATGAEPIKLSVPGSDNPRVHYLRSLADSRALIAATKEAQKAVVVGASFIGLEVAASLRARGVEVHMVAPEARPLERVMGPALGDFIRALHEEHGVQFHLKHTLKSIQDGSVELDDGTTLSADVIVVGIGVRPALALAEEAGLKTDNGVCVNEYLESSVPGIYAAGDIARWPSPHAGKDIRVEHWVVAERQGQTAARNMLGTREPFHAVPFFWSQHYDVPIAYVGYAEGWDQGDVAGSLEERSCFLAYRKAGKIVAVATINRDRENLQAEHLLEKRDAAGLEALLQTLKK
jgi:NADPH-dependent 2,4-dienoyl-CoA reductase/sulfur reductase-like enzyme/nitrite reductase/ring-hydroxylating ferredoxin subunit